jgi:GAF domain-containing protein
VPGVTGAWFIPDPARDRLVVGEPFGPASQALRGVHVGMGERLTGWVAAQRQAIMNSDAALDIGDRVGAVDPPLTNCMSVPIIAGDTLVAVLSLYASRPDTFNEDRGRLVQMVAPHIALAIQSAAATGAVSPGDSRAVTERATTAPLRLVAR